MNKNSNNVYDLEKRTYKFALSISKFCKVLPKTINSIEYIRQLIRSSGSVGANYIEANESLGKKDFMMKIKICRKEAKESAFWLNLIIETNDEKFRKEGLDNFNEAIELKKIFSAILNN